MCTDPHMDNLFKKHDKYTQSSLDLRTSFLRKNSHGNPEKKCKNLNAVSAKELAKPN